MKKVFILFLLLYSSIIIFPEEYRQALIRLENEQLETI